MEPQREAYIVKWTTSLLARVKQSGLNELQLGQAWEHALSPMIEGVLIPDAVLHRFNVDEYIAVVKKHFNVQGNRIIIPDSPAAIIRQDTVGSSTPLTNRKKFSDRINGTHLLRYYDPYIGGAWLSTFIEILTLLETRPNEIQLLSSDEKIRKPLELNAVTSLIKQLAKEFDIKIVLKVTPKEHPRFFIANDKIWKIGHSLNNLDQFEGLDEQIESKSEYEKFWSENWSTQTTIVTT